MYDFAHNGNVIPGPAPFPVPRVLLEGSSDGRHFRVVGMRSPNTYARGSHIRQTRPTYSSTTLGATTSSLRSHCRQHRRMKSANSEHVNRSDWPMAKTTLMPSDLEARVSEGLLPCHVAGRCTREVQKQSALTESLWRFPKTAGADRCW